MVASTAGSIPRDRRCGGTAEPGTTPRHWPPTSTGSWSNDEMSPRSCDAARRTSRRFSWARTADSSPRPTDLFDERRVDQNDPQPTTARPIAVVSGGVGAARFLPRTASTPSTTRGDVHHGGGEHRRRQHASRPVDLARPRHDHLHPGRCDRPERGWGLVGESWRAMASLERYESVRPTGSSAAPRWFNLGDHDLATHFYRTARLAEGATLTEVTDEIRRAWGVADRIVPMSDDRVEHDRDHRRRDGRARCRSRTTSSGGDTRCRSRPSVRR